MKVGLQLQLLMAHLADAVREAVRGQAVVRHLAVSVALPGADLGAIRFRRISDRYYLCGGRRSLLSVLSHDLVHGCIFELSMQALESR